METPRETLETNVEALKVLAGQYYNAAGLISGGTEPVSSEAVILSSATAVLLIIAELQMAQLRVLMDIELCMPTTE